jgi:NAD(P)-dependent dehydrogenase (short-subunit alcohol dehydrogenase family)
MVNKDSELALVTGASSGIGEALARRLARDGYKLAVVARRANLLERLATELAEEYGVEVEVLVADLATDEGISKVEDFIAKTPVHMLVNNAGFSVDGSFMEADFTGQLNMVTVHDIATLRLTRAALPGMLKRGAGSIISISSMGGLVPVPGDVHRVPLAGTEGDWHPCAGALPGLYPHRLPHRHGCCAQTSGDGMDEPGGRSRGIAGRPRKRQDHIYSRQVEPVELRFRAGTSRAGTPLAAAKTG